MRYKLQDLIDIQHFQNLQNRLNEIYSFPSSIIDNDGNILTASGRQDICTQFHRKNKETEKLCIQSDQYIKDHIHEANPAVSYRCPLGLVDNATPIIIGGIHYGNFFTGQFFLENPDLEFFKVQAKKYDFDEDTYLKAVKNVPVWTQGQLDSCLFFIKGLIAVISESGLKTLKEIENRKQIEVSERRYKSILKTAMDGYWLTDTEGRLLEVNNAYCSMSGYNDDELLTMRIADLDIEENLQITAQHMQKVISQGSDRFESLHRRKDGTVFDVEVSVQFRSEEGGQCVCFIRDITDRKLAEETLRKNELKYRQLVQTASDGIYFISDVGKILDVNPSACSMLGRTRDEILQLNTDGVDPKFTVQEFLSFWEDVPYNEPRIFESSYQHKDGSLISVEVSSQKFRIGRDTYYYSISRDITEREFAKKALLSSESKWKNILINTPQIGVSINTEAKITFANNHFLKLTGWQEHDVVGQDWFDMFIPEHAREETREVFFAVIRKKDTAEFSTYQNEIRDKSESLINVVWSNVLTKDINENVVDVTCLGIDVTEREKAEAALQENEAYMNSIFRAAPTGIGVVHDRILRQVNERFCEMLRYSQEELIGQPAEIVYPSIEEFERVGREKYGQIQEKGTGTVETLLQRKNGEIINVLLSSTPIDPNDLGAGVTFTALDITNRKQAEKSLRESHERFLTVLDSIDATIYVADMETYEILFMNRHMIDTFGRNMTGEICWKAFRGESIPCSHCSNARLVDINNIPTGASVWNDKNPITGKMYINHDRAIKWTDGRLVRLQIATDVTDLLKIEAQLRQAQKMQSIGTLAGGIAHEFNNILAIIMGNNELIMDELPPKGLSRESAEEIRIAGLRARDVVKQLLTFSRQDDVVKKVMDFKFVVQKSMKLIRSSIPVNIKIEQNLSADLYPVMADETQINQILINLCNNAVDAMPEMGGIITIELLNEIIDKRQTKHQTKLKPGQYAKLMVRDNGIGMDDVILDRVFEPYFTTKDIGEGTGIGMAVVHGIVEKHDGAIIVDSKPGQGTIFTIFLPAHEGLLGQGADEQDILPVGDECILYVDDEPSIALLGKRHLENLGYTAESTTDPQQALDMVKSDPIKFDLLITDMAMPNMTGDQLIIETLKIRPNMPTIICTGYSAKISEKEAADIGARSYIMKPISKSELATAVRKVLDSAKKSNLAKP